MTKYARVKDGRLIDVWRIPEDFPDTGTRDRCLGSDAWIEVHSDAKHGAKRNDAGEYINPVDEAPRIVPKWDAFDFKMRFTADERKAIRAAAKIDADVEDFVDMLDTAAATSTMIHADSPLVIAALTEMEGSIIASGRKAEILGD